MISVFFTAPGVKLLLTERPFALLEDLADLVFGNGEIFPLHLLYPENIVLYGNDPVCCLGKENHIFFNSFSTPLLEFCSVQTVAVGKCLTAIDGLCHLGAADISGRHTAASMIGEGENSVHKYALSFFKVTLH